MRGEDELVFIGDGGHGIIPAGAGRRALLGKRFAACRDHPRGCGEKGRENGGWGRGGGSSPRVRGEVPPHSFGAVRRGIIPAGAGRRGHSASLGGRWGDHPRGCGEKNTSRIVRMLTQGSSPRVRGEVCAHLLLEVEAGIIPAGAGRRPVSLGSRPGVRDHPRGCGEKNDGNLIPLGQRGSSPRVRGEVDGRSHERRLDGIIPAGAGRRRRRGHGCG